METVLPSAVKRQAFTHVWVLEIISDYAQVCAHIGISWLSIYPAASAVVIVQNVWGFACLKYDVSSKKTQEKWKIKVRDDIYSALPTLEYILQVSESILLRLILTVLEFIC